MKNNVKLYKSILITAIMLMVLLMPLSVHANVQSRPDKSRLVNKSIQDFFELIRKMETSTGPMGLNATIEQQADPEDNTKIKIVESSSSNNIDVHMIKNTEWGAVAMLMDSQYGSKLNGAGDATSTTTDNATGVYQFFSGWEYVAGMWDTKNSYNGKLYYSDAKYWDKYTEAVAKTGDATTETTRWKGTSNAGFVSSGNPVFGRGISGAFSFNAYTGSAGTALGSRAAVVCGARTLVNIFEGKTLRSFPIKVTKEA